MDTPRTPELAERRSKLSLIVEGTRADAFLTSFLPNCRYLSGFTGSNAALLVSPDRSILFTDPRYELQAPQEADCEVRIVKGSLINEVAKWAKRLRVRTLAFESQRITFGTHKELKEATPGIRLKPVANAVEGLRMVKSEGEIEAIRVSVELNSKALEKALRRFKSSMTEMDLAAEIEYRMRRLGAERPSFETIVAAGERSALPHARPTSKAIGTDHLLLIDMGSSVAGYASDMTRTFAVGNLDGKSRRMYRAVLESQLAAIDAIKPGVLCGSVDGAARKVLRGYALERYFVHSTGHGLGLEIHEPPRVGRKEQTKLEAGMVITIEPGVYEAGVGGIRIEDTVVVTNDGCKPLTPTPKELTVL
ncbi:MAG: M24 family metallopeptidase [Bryobacteraceae bacterium]